MIENKVEEKVTITVEDQESEMEDMIDCLMDHSYELNTMLSGEASTFTEILMGELKTLLLISDKPINIKITFAEYPEIVLLDLKQFVGAKYFPLKCNSFNENGELFNYGSVNYVLNDILDINISGNLNTNTKVIFRIKK